MNVRARSRTVNRRLNSAGLKVRRPRRRPCLTLDHRYNRMQWAAGKRRWTLATCRRIYWSDESRFMSRFTNGRLRVWCKRGEDPFRVVEETDIFGGGSVMV